MANNTSIRGLQIKDNFFGAALIRNSGNNDIMDVNVDDSSIEVSTDAIRVKDLGITDAMLAGSISDGKLTEDYIKTSEVDGTTIEFAGSSLNVVADGIGATELDETDNYTFSGTVKVNDAPVAGTDVANKDYVDGVAAGLDWKESVRLASDDNSNWTGTATADFVTGTGVLTISSLTAGSSLGLIDVVEAVSGNRILLKDMATISALTTDSGGEATPGKYNGIWEVTGGTTTSLTLTRTTDANDNSDVTAGLATFVAEGSVNADRGYVLTTNDPITVNTTDLVFTQFNGTEAITAGDGLTKTGDVLSVNVDDSTIEINADTLRVKASGITANELGADSVTAVKLNADTAGLGLGQAAGGELDVNVDDSSIEINADTLRVKAGGVTDAMLAVDYIQTTEVDGTTIEFSGGTLNVVALGIDTAQLAALAVTNAKIADDTIAEVKLDIFNAPSVGEVLGFTANGLEWVSGTSDSVVEGDIAKENESANANGATTVFTITSTPIANSLQVYLNGLLQEDGSGKDYTISGTSVTFATAPLTGDILIIHYIIDN